jgi:hypothetical protein
MLRSFVLAAAFATAVAVPGVPATTILAAAPLELCDGAPNINYSDTWLVTLWERGCVNFGWRLDGDSRTLKDNSRGVMFRLAIEADDCVKLNMTSDDFVPDLYVYRDSQQTQEVGSGAGVANEYSTVLRGTGAAVAQFLAKGRGYDLPTYYVLATSAGGGEQLGSFQLQIRGC